MAILKIARMGHPVLLRRCDPVPDPGAPEIRRLVADMMETMEDAPGVGLAAPQVYVPLRLFVFRVPGERRENDPDDLPVGNTVLINPELELLSEERVLGWEGCLSIPGMRAGVPRAPRVRYRGVDCDGNVVEREVSGFHASDRAARIRPPGRDPLHHADDRFPPVRLQRGTEQARRRDGGRPMIDASRAQPGAGRGAGSDAAERAVRRLDLSRVALRPARRSACRRRRRSCCSPAARPT